MATAADDRIPPGRKSKPEVTNLDEVVVTAQKVSQSVIDVPLSISVLGGDDLDRTQSLNIQDYVKLVPGLQLTQATPGFGRLVVTRHQHRRCRINRRRVRR